MVLRKGTEAQHGHLTKMRRQRSEFREAKEAVVCEA